MSSRSLVTALVAGAAVTTLAIAPVAAGGEVNELPITYKLPKAIKVKGKAIEKLWTWNDFESGQEGYAVFSATDTMKGGRLTGRKIFVQVYGGKGDAQKELRMINDGVTGCDLDVHVGFIDGSISISDEDDDGIKEVTFVYDVACTGDVSPAVRKLLVLEGKDKHGLRGTSRIDAGGGDVVGGEYKADPFKKAPALKALAEQRWKDMLGK